MVKRRSYLASNEAFRVRFLVELLSEVRSGKAEGRSKDGSLVIGHLNIRSFLFGVRGVAVSARLAVNQKAWVRLPSDTLGKEGKRERGYRKRKRSSLFPFSRIPIPDH